MEVPFRFFMSGGCFPRESHAIQSGTVDVFGVKDSYFDFSILRYFLLMLASRSFTIARASNQPNPLAHYHLKNAPVKKDKLTDAEKKKIKQDNK